MGSGACARWSSNAICTPPASDEILSLLDTNDSGHEVTHLKRDPDLGFELVTLGPSGQYAPASQAPRRSGACGPVDLGT